MQGRNWRVGKGKKEERSPCFSEKRGGWGNEKSHGKRGGLPWGFYLADVLSLLGDVINS